MAIVFFSICRPEGGTCEMYKCSSHEEGEREFADPFCVMFDSKIDSLPVNPSLHIQLACLSRPEQSPNVKVFFVITDT
jgi:hypothetical protein